MAQRVPVPDRIARLNLLDRVDYADAYAAPLAAERHSPEELVRLAFGSTPRWVPAFIRTAQRITLRFRLDADTAPGHLPGWQVLRNDAEEIVYGATGPLMTGRVTLTRDAGRVVLITQLHYHHRLARPIWWFVGNVHRLIATILVSRGARLAAV